MNLGAIVGLSASGGILLAASGWIRTLSPRLVDRLERAGAIRRRVSRRDSLVATMTALVGRVSIVNALVHGDAKLTGALVKAGKPPDVAVFRLRQLVWIAVGAGCGALVAVRALIEGRLIAVALVVAVGASMGLWASQRALVIAGNRRSKRIGEQLPVIAELVAFCVAAGEPIIPALRRSSNLTNGEFSHELALCLDHISSGATPSSGLRLLAERCDHQQVERFVDGLLIAQERGTPLAEVLRAQAKDARAAIQRGLIESAGRKEVLMLMPVVFLILPTVIVIALFPGIAGLNLIAS